MDAGPAKTGPSARIEDAGRERSYVPGRDEDRERLPPRPER